MKLEGYRTDGTLRVLIPGGVTIILQGDLASPPLDDRDADRLGPWLDPPVALSWQERQELQHRLDRSRVVPAQTFALQFPFQKKKAAPAEGTPAEEAGETPAEEATEPAADAADAAKGDLLATIKAIAAARAKEKDDQAKAAAAGPHSSSKRLKLEYSVEDHAGEAKDDKKKDDKPVSEVGAAPDGPVLNLPPVVPDHLQPMEKQS